jgi:DNA-binding MarR family transcriptional regulator
MASVLVETSGKHCVRHSRLEEGLCRGRCHTRDVARRGPAKTSHEELVAFEVAARDLVGLALRSVEQQDVSLPQFRLLLVLDELGPSSSTQCAHALGVAGSSVTRLADRLDASGHLSRGVDPSNRSIAALELTDAGRRVVRQVTTHRRRALTTVLDRLDTAERQTCAAVLRRLHEMLAATATDTAPDRLPL